MPVVSIRFSDADVHARLRESAEQQDVSISTLAQQLIDEGLRMHRHPSIVFRGGPAGRRPALAGGPDVADVVGAIVRGDVPSEQRRERASELLALAPAQVDAALAYYAEFTAEVDAELDARVREADEQEALWRRQQDLLKR